MFKVLDNVVVKNQRCCDGFPVGTVCQVIDVYPKENPKSFLCFPSDPTSDLKFGAGKWHCKNCLRKTNEK